jgi:LPXTG-motif cell wall-anchored protein
LEELATFWSSLEFDNPLYFWIGGALILLLIFIPWFRKRRGLLLIWVIGIRMSLLKAGESGYYLFLWL